MGAISGRLVSAALDPVLTAAGFAGGQYGDLVGPTQIIFCAAFDELGDRYPDLPQAKSQDRDVGACVDLVLDLDAEGRLEFVYLEELSLDETLRRVGHADAADRTALLSGQRIDDALPVLQAVLSELFGS